MFKPTKEQQQAIDVFMQGKNMKINAYAGSGKTSTLKLLARERTSPGVYLCFNKSIATEAAKAFPETVACKTTHSFAYRAVVPKYKGKTDKMVNSLRAKDTVSLLNLRDFPIFGNTDRLDATTVGYAVNQAIRRFCQSDEREFEHKHFEILPKFSTLPADEFYALRTRVLQWAKQVWAMAIDPTTNVPLGHDGYVKVWQLSDPVIDTCYILVDEAQDTNPVMLDILRRQEAQIVYVGDRHQQIYEWRGAINAMEVAPVHTTVNLTKSFRFGPAIADFASNILATIGETNRIEGNELINSTLSHDTQKTILCRTNAQILDSLIGIVSDREERAYVAGGVDDLIRCLEGVERLQHNRPSSYNLFMGFKDWDEFLGYAKESGDMEANKIIKLVDKYNTARLIDVLNSVETYEGNADIILTTGHKSKGREWSGVELAPDFKEQPEKDKDGNETINASETRLFYVSATRAINTLKVPGWAYEQYGKGVPMAEKEEVAQ